MESKNTTPPTTQDFKEAEMGLRKDREIAAMGDAEPENEKLTSVLRHLISRRIMKIEQ